MRKEKQSFRLNMKLRRRGQAALDHNRAEFKTESYDDDESFCLAVASELLEMIQLDREFLNQLEGTDDE